MTPEQVRSVVEIYRTQLESLGAKPIDYPHAYLVTAEDDILGHCLGMLDKMLEFVDEGRMDKAFRWLGFIQGCLWALGYYCMEDLKDHNRPTETGP